MKKNKVKNKNKNSVIKKLIFICIGIIVFEAVIMILMFLTRELSIDYVDGINGVIKIDDGYIAVGGSNFNKSDYVKKKIYQHEVKETSKKENIIANQARLVKYDDSLNIIWEKTFSCDYDSIFYNVISVDDGYIAVGSYIYDYKQIDLNTRDGLIVKYDKEGNILWYRNYQKLGDTEFFNIIVSNDDYVVVGQSIYENMEMGNHFNGGGIIIKYNKDGEVIAENSYGGNKSGLFTDVCEVDDGYIVSGGDAGKYGIVVKFKKDFNRDIQDEKLISDKVVWQRTYSYTDNAGFTDIEINNNKIYVTGAISVSSEKDSVGNEIYLYDAGYIVYDMDGKMLDKYTFGGSGLDRYNSMIIDNDSIIMIGSTNSVDIDILDYPKYNTQTGILVKYDLKGNILQKNYFGGKKVDILSKIIKVDDKYLVVGTSNSKRGLLGYDYQTIIKFYDTDLKAK